MAWVPMRRPGSTAITATSGRVLAESLAAALAVSASATTWMALSASRIARRPARTIA